MIKGSSNRKPAFPVYSLLVDRWSPRAMSGEPLTDAELMPLLEAARWAPSASNEQPWRFLFAKAGTAHFNTYLDFLAPPNRVWCERAGALLVVVSHTWNVTHNVKASTHSLDAGAAWQNFALQGFASGLAVHGMAGFDRAKARAALKIPEEYHVEMMIAVGKPGDPQQLSDALRSREVPSDRRPLDKTACEGEFSL